jgi:protein OS-9
MRHTLALSCCFHLAAARLLHSLPEDTYAFPKYRVSFLNAVLRHTAERWLHEGLRGGQSEFLGQPWEDEALIGIDSGEPGDVRYIPTNTPVTRIDSKSH